MPLERVLEMYNKKTAEAITWSESNWQTSKSTSCNARSTNICGSRLSAKSALYVTTKISEYDLQHAHPGVTRSKHKAG